MTYSSGSERSLGPSGPEPAGCDAVGSYVDCRQSEGKRMNNLHGVLTALVTPFTAGGDEVDEASLRTLVEYNVTSNVHGLIPAGSTGEFAAMSNKERRQVVEIVVDQTAGRVPVIVQTGAMTTRDAIALSQHAEKSGAAAVMVVAPYYEPLTVAETMNHFRSIASSIDVDVMVYNLPVATGVNLLPEDVAELAMDVPNIKYLKDTSGDYAQAARLIHEYSDVLGVFIGHDTLYFAALVEGAAGAVNGGANFIAPELVDVYNSIRSGHIAAARDLWNRVFPVAEFLMSGGYVTGVKGALKILGRPVGDPRAPMESLEGEREAELRKILAAFETAAV
jgi:4-hydroxy-tetrahydrodipicolinate synthase